MISASMTAITIDCTQDIAFSLVSGPTIFWINSKNLLPNMSPFFLDKSLWYNYHYYLI